MGFDPEQPATPLPTLCVTADPPFTEREIDFVAAAAVGIAIVTLKLVEVAATARLSVLGCTGGSAEGERLELEQPLTTKAARTKAKRFIARS
ncbi:MAG: hypothetical protein JO165_03970 [Candidatus Eremiobacteraeota bacterium]|nr:hypothetical protein [Candidatus Eremiobacteraeota bacterium]